MIEVAEQERGGGLWKAGRRGGAAEGAGFRGCGRNAGLLFWVAVEMMAEGGMEGKVVELGEGKWREGEGVVVRGDGGLGTRGRGWRQGRLLGAVVVRGVREEGFGCDGAEIMGGGRREEESGGCCQVRRGG